MLSLQQFVSNLKDTGSRFQVDVERGLAVNPTLYKPEATFSEWWRAFYHYIRTDNPKTVDDVQAFDDNLPTRKKAKK